jgi:hypothetical protein
LTKKSVVSQEMLRKNLLSAIPAPKEWWKNEEVRNCAACFPLGSRVECHGARWRLFIV